MHDICEENSYFKERAILGNYKKAIVETQDFTAAYIQETSYLMNIELNFVHNANMKLGHYGTALESFKNVLKAKHDHPIALYYSGLCYQHLGELEPANECFNRASTSAQGNSFWEDIIHLFEIPIFQANTVLRADYD